MQSEKELYEQFVKRHRDGNFFQSLAFGEFQEKIPYRGKSWALLGKEATCLIIKMRSRLGKCWFWIPYGPLGFSEEVCEDLGRIAKEEKAIFARVEPPAGWHMSYMAKLQKRWRIVPTKSRFTAEHSLLLDLAKTESELLAQMKPKGRYNIQVAKRHGVMCQKFLNFAEIPKKDFDAFYGLLRQTSERDEFGIHPKYFYETLLKTLGDKTMASLFLAYHKENVVAGIIVVYYKNTATYYYGASDHEARNLMAPYALQWEAILDAKRRGMETYDFLGIAPPDKPNHSWAGITNFKKKFGGREVSYPKAFDVVYRSLLYRGLRFFR